MLSSYPNRTYCEVVEEMRKCYETMNFGGMIGLIEELQSIGNKMEAGLGDKNDCKRWNEYRSELKAEIKVLEAKKKKLEKKVKKKKK